MENKLFGDNKMIKSMDHFNEIIKMEKNPFKKDIEKLIPTLDEVTVKDETADRILNWFENFSEFDYSHLPLEQGILRIGKVQLIFLASNNHIYMSITTMPSVAYWLIEKEVAINSIGKTVIKITMPDAFREALTNDSYDTILKVSNLWIAIMSYMRDFKGSPDRVRKETNRVTSKKKSKKGSNKKRVVYLSKNTYSLSKPIDDPIEKKEFERHVESWTVRGHMRKYKNGKEIWIKSHKKGQGKVEKKEYRV